MKKSLNILTIVLAVAAMIAAFSCPAQAAVTGICSNCHTMHNSQNGADMATFGVEGWVPEDDTANDVLLRGTCLGCHGQGGTNHIINDIPQVYHTGATDLAGGNFKYIYAALSEAKGHNVRDLVNHLETTLTVPPGDEHDTGITNANFTCAGVNGCHGDRTVTDPYASLSGAHHGGVSGYCDGTGTDLKNSYRFLKGVIGLEQSTWQNVSATDHNEYFGKHSAAEATKTSAPEGTISQLCAECHGNFHGTADICGAATPFTRHPADITLTNDGEYAAYTTYSTQAPIARSALDSGSVVSNTVVPGTDVVMCLSCHGAHATDFNDILRWDYAGMIAGSESAVAGGCFTCHTTKAD